MPHGLVDQFNMMVYPVVLSRGIKLFPDGFTANLELQDFQQFGGGIKNLINRLKGNT
jgi:dihydrofolate reductase